MKHARTKRIEAAIREAKRRDNYTCRICRIPLYEGTPTDGAHCLPRNVAFPAYDPADPAMIITMCRGHHLSYDRAHGVDKKIAWLKKHGLRNEAAVLMQITGREEKPSGRELNETLKRMGAI